MKYTSNPQTIQGYLTNRLLCEQQLAHELLAEFGQGQFNRDVQTAVGRMLWFLINLSGPAHKVLEKQEQNQNFLAGLKDHGGTTVKAYQALLRNPNGLTLVHCADLIRFYGEIIDNCSQAPDGTSLWFRQERIKQIAWRYGGGGAAYAAGAKYDQETGMPVHAKADQGTVWQKVGTEKTTNTASQWKKNRPSEFGLGGRIRMKPNQSPIKPLFANSPGTADPYYGLVPGAAFNSTAFKSVGVGSDKFAGSFQWVLQNTSTIKRIDLAFGLPYAADISGTTTDCMHFMSGYADLGGSDPLLLMLPLATIVGSYHHSLLEVAMAMSLKKVIDYKMTFYSTLLPALPAGAQPHPQRSAVRMILQKYDERPDAPHILIHYVNAKPAGAFIMEQGDYDKFKQLATCDIRQWPRFNKMGDYPTEDDIMQLFRDVGLLDAALQSRRGALRPVGPRPSDSLIPKPRPFPQKPPKPQ